MAAGMGHIFGGPCPSSALHTPDNVIAIEGLVDTGAHDHLSRIHPLHKEQVILANPSHGTRSARLGMSFTLVFGKPTLLGRMVPQAHTSRFLSSVNRVGLV